ncbi:MAG: nucleoid occlusion protein [Chloroflexota bacterium]
MKERFSLFGRRDTVNRDEVRFVPLADIKTNPYQPRRSFDEEQLAELTASIKEYGVLQPLVTRRAADGTYELIAGERRLRAAKLAGLERVPVVIRDVRDEDSAMLALVENLQRSDLGFLEEATGYARLLAEFGLTQEELAERLGKKQSTIANKLRLLKLTPDVQRTLVELGASERHARALLALDDEAAQLEVLQEVRRADLTVRQTEELVNELAAGRREAAPAAAVKAQRRRIVKVFKDLRIFINTFREAVKVLRASGVEATMEEQDQGDVFEVRVRIRKPAR